MDSFEKKLFNWRVSLNDGNSSLEEEEDEEGEILLRSRVRANYVHHLQQSLRKNLETFSENDKSIDLQHHIIDKMVEKFSSMFEEKALRRCMIARLYQKVMAHMIKEIKRSTTECKIFKGFDEFAHIWNEDNSLDKETQTDITENDIGDPLRELIGSSKNNPIFQQVIALANFISSNSDDAANVMNIVNNVLQDQDKKQSVSNPVLEENVVLNAIPIVNSFKNQSNVHTNIPNVDSSSLPIEKIKTESDCDSTAQMTTLLTNNDVPSINSSNVISNQNTDTTLNQNSLPGISIHNNDLYSACISEFIENDTKDKNVTASNMKEDQYRRNNDKKRQYVGDHLPSNKRLSGHSECKQIDSKKEMQKNRNLYNTNHILKISQIPKAPTNDVKVPMTKPMLSKGLATKTDSLEERLRVLFSGQAASNLKTSEPILPNKKVTPILLKKKVLPILLKKKDEPIRQKQKVLGTNNKFRCSPYEEGVALLHCIDYLDNNLPPLTSQKIRSTYHHLFGVDHDVPELTSEQQSEICLNRIGRFVTDLLSIYYNKKRISSKPVFKSLAKYITNTIFKRSPFPRRREIEKYITDLFTDNKIIENEADFLCDYG